jgi:hypothetical protein
VTCQSWGCQCQPRGRRAARRTGGPHGGVGGNGEWGRGRSLHELWRRWNKGVGRKITARSKQRGEKGEWGPVHGARFKGEGALAKRWMGGWQPTPAQNRRRRAAHGRRTCYMRHGRRGKRGPHAWAVMGPLAWAGLDEQ